MRPPQQRNDGIRKMDRVSQVLGSGKLLELSRKLEVFSETGSFLQREVFTKNWKFQANLETGIFFRNWEWTQNLKVLSEPGSSLRNLELKLKLGVSWELEVNSETGSFPRILKFLSETGSFLTDCGSCLENWEFFPESENFLWETGSSLGNWKFSQELGVNLETGS